MFKFKINNHQDVARFVLQREKDLIKLMRGGNVGEPMHEVSNSSCSYISHLLGHFIKMKSEGVNDLFTLEGIGKGLTETDGHRILGLVTSEGISAIDGTIWQVSPDEKHMGIYGPFMEESRLLEFLAFRYGGEWRKKAIPEFFLTKEGAKQLIRLLALKAEGRNFRRNDVVRRK